MRKSIVSRKKRESLRIGFLSDFFQSAKQTAREIDEGGKITRKHIIWVDPTDINELIKRTGLLQYLRKNKKSDVRQIAKDMNRTLASLNRDLNVLSKYQLIRVYSEINQGSGAKKFVEVSFGNQKIELKAEI